VARAAATMHSMTSPSSTPSCCGNLGSRNSKRTLLVILSGIDIFYWACSREWDRLGQFFEN
jgi:hypothetical protein